jgi:VIT1/CCC1 family predicted Fe2+/Mn2+ transporter
MFSGAISMAAGSYLSSSAEKDIFDKELRDAEVLAETEPYLAAEGLLKALNQEGLAREQSYNIVKVLLRQEHAFLRTFQEKVFGLGSAEINRPFQGALVMALSFMVGGFCADRAVSTNCRTNRFVSFDCAIRFRALWSGLGQRPLGG